MIWVSIISFFGILLSGKIKGMMKSTYIILGAFAKFRNATISFVMSVRRSAWNNWASNGKDFHEIWYLWISQKSVEKIQVSLKSERTGGILNAGQYTF